MLIKQPQYSRIRSWSIRRVDTSGQNTEREKTLSSRILHLPVPNTRASDAKLGEQDRKDYARILESLRTYVSENNGYWKVREVPNDLRFQGWNDPDGSWDQPLK